MAKFLALLRPVIVGLVLALCAVPVCSAEGVFIPLGAAGQTQLPSASVLPNRHSVEGPAAPANGWLVRVDQQRLLQKVHAVERAGSGRLLLNVAEGLAFEVAVERTQRTLSGHSLSGHLAGTAGSAVTLVVHAQAVTGSIWTPGGAYEVVPLKAGVHVVREVDLAARPRLGEPIRTEGGWGQFRPAGPSRCGRRQPGRCACSVDAEDSGKRRRRGVDAHWHRPCRGLD